MAAVPPGYTCSAPWLLAVAYIALSLTIPTQAKLPGHVCQGSESDSYCSCRAWPSSRAPYVGFIDEASELKQALAAASFRKE